VALFLVSAIGGSLGFELLVPDLDGPYATIMVGASGAVFGLFATVILVQRRLGMDSGPLLGLLGINLAFGFLFPNIAWQGHLGGLVAGAACALVLVYGPRRERSWLQWFGLAAVTAVLLAAAFLGAGR
jgi:membrane associated rhomboid family serine protease